MMTPTYVDENYLYTDPSSYDRRDMRKIESYLYSFWNPILLETIKKYIQKDSIIADLGCGTFIHTQYMGVAKHIYAVDVCQGMLNYGLPKIESIKGKVTVLCEDASKTSIPGNSCDIVWIDGLSEFVDIEKLFLEVDRILKKGGTFSILYHNRFNPFNMLVFCAYKLFGRKGKTYRHLFQFNRASKKYQYELIEMHGSGITFYTPDYLVPICAPFWKILDFIYTPIEKHFPMGHNILCVYKKK